MADNEVIQGLDSLLRKLSAMGEDAAPIMQKGVNKGLKRIQSSAKLLCPSNSGELRNSIKTQSRVQGGKVVGEVYTNKEHAAYVEFGTGPVGEETLQEVPEGLNITHSPTGWWIHVGEGENDISPEIVEKYHFFTITGEDGEKYAFSNGSPAQPFMYPALEANRDNVLHDVAGVIHKEIIKKVRNSD